MNFSDLLCVWYLRFNGYFTMANFIAHGQPASLTDFDVVGVRFKDSRELNFSDDTRRLHIPQDVKVDIILAEATSRRCKVNGPWSRPNRGVEYVLERVGVFPSEEIPVIANSLFKKRKYVSSDKTFCIRIVCFGSKKNRNLQAVTQIVWSDVVSFISQRFREHQDVKADHQQWDYFGKYLWDSLLHEKLLDLKSLEQGWVQTLRKESSN